MFVLLFPCSRGRNKMNIYIHTHTATGSFCQRANMHDYQLEAHGAGSRFQGGGGVTGSQIAIRWACKRSAAGERLL